MHRVRFDEVEPGDIVLLTEYDGDRLVVGKVQCCGTRFVYGDRQEWSLCIAFTWVHWLAWEHDVERNSVWVISSDDCAEMRQIYRFDDVAESQAFMLGEVI